MTAVAAVEMARSLGCSKYITRDHLLTLSRVWLAALCMCMCVCVCVWCVASYPELGTRVGEKMDLPEVISGDQEAFIVIPADSVDVCTV